jgi:ubiquinone/menaquinone biosynthesis C-methylase UbiE
MTILKNLKKYINSGRSSSEKESTEAYNLWAPQYDNQPDNLMLHLDNEVFDQLLHGIELKDKVVIDVGCGTGRHWHNIIDKAPAQLVGYDVSNGMLSELRRKFPDAEVQLASDTLLTGIMDNTVDVIISTLTIAHIENIDETFSAWARVLKSGGEVLLTDFHPAVLGQGGKRDFTANNERVVIRNFVHPVGVVKATAAENELQPVIFIERFIDERVREFYHKQNALHVYERFKGMPIIYGIHLQKS